MSKYSVIVEWVQKNITEGVFSSGQKLPSECELAEQFQVSRQTVRRALEVLDASGHVKSRQGSGTFVAEKIRERKNRCKRVALVTTYIDNYIFPKIIKGIEETLYKQGYQVQMYFTNNTGSREEMVLKDLLTLDLSGVIIEPTKSALPNPNMYLYRKLIERDIPMVFINSKYKELDVPMISLDDEKAGRDMVQYLIERGHTKIAGIFKMDDGQGMRRYMGYMKGLLENGIPIRGRHVTWIDTKDIASIELIEQKILARIVGCTAVICYNDQLACGVMDILNKNRIRVPEDVSIISVDNTEMANSEEIGLTSIHHPKEELGKKASQILLGMMASEQIGYDYEFDGEIVERESVRIVG